MLRTFKTGAMALLILVAIAGVANYFQLQDLRGLVQPSITEPISIEVTVLSKLTMIKVVNEVTYELVCCQGAMESYPDFVRRCTAEFKILCNELEE